MNIHRHSKEHPIRAEDVIRPKLPGLLQEYAHKIHSNEAYHIKLNEMLNMPSTYMEEVAQPAPPMLPFPFVAPAAAHPPLHSRNLVGTASTSNGVEGSGYVYVAARNIVAGPFGAPSSAANQPSSSGKTRRGGAGTVKTCSECKKRGDGRVLFAGHSCPYKKCSACKKRGRDVLFQGHDCPYKDEPKEKRKKT